MIHLYPTLDALYNRTIGVNLAILHGVLGTVDINMRPL